MLYWIQKFEFLITIRDIIEWFLFILIYFLLIKFSEI